MTAYTPRVRRQSARRRRRPGAFLSIPWKLRPSKLDRPIETRCAPTGDSGRVSLALCTVRAPRGNDLGSSTRRTHPADRGHSAVGHSVQNWPARSLKPHPAWNQMRTGLDWTGPATDEWTKWECMLRRVELYRVDDGGVPGDGGGEVSVNDRCSSPEWSVNVETRWAAVARLHLLCLRAQIWHLY